MRSIHILLKVVLENFDKHFSYGLCFLISDLRVHQIITDEEYIKLSKYIEKNRPLSFNLWSWEPKLAEPRKEWLITHIKLTEPLYKKIFNLGKNILSYLKFKK